jgi:hypothetical protein
MMGNEKMRATFMEMKWNSMRQECEIEQMAFGD